MLYHHVRTSVASRSGNKLSASGELRFWFILQLCIWSTSTQCSARGWLPGASRQGRPETWCDITLWVGEERLPAHGALLACRSRTFRRLLTSKWLPHVRCQTFPRPAALSHLMMTLSQY